MKQFFRNLLVILFGNLLMQLGLALFILPSGLVTGGTAGIALCLQHFLDLPVSAFMAVFNALMFLLGLLLLGKAFAMTTLVSTIASPVILAVLEQVLGGYMLTDDLLLCTLFGGILVGTAIAMVVKAGASTGGMDIPPLLLQKFAGIPVGRSLYVFDTVILLGQAFFANRDQLLYGILLVIVYSLVIDTMMAQGDRRYQLEIISSKSDAIRQAIQFAGSGIIENIEENISYMRLPPKNAAAGSTED